MPCRLIEVAISEPLMRYWKAAWDSVYCDVKVTERLLADDKSYREGWPAELPKAVVVNRYVQLSDDGRQLASWDPAGGWREARASVSLRRLEIW